MGRVLMCSVAPTSFKFDRTYRNAMEIPACAPGEVFSSTWIEDAVDYKVVYLGLGKDDKDVTPIPVMALDIAKDLLTNGDLEREGVWICPSSHPTEAEIEKAKDTRAVWLVKCVNDGNALYAKYGDRGIDQIPDFMKRAAKELGESCPWVLTGTTRKYQCEGCGTYVDNLRDGTPPAYCPNCKSVLNPERAAKLQQLDQSVKPATQPKEKAPQVGS